MNRRVESFIPPIVCSVIQRMKTLLCNGGDRNVEIPRWCVFTGGRLAGRPFLCNPDVKEYQSMMLGGTFDDFLFKQVDKFDWSGKVIFDIGSHVGFHVLNFAERVGPDGKVFSFEPHPLHRERIAQNLARNQDLLHRVTIIPVAVGNQMGRTKFFCTNAIEGSGSSMSFIEEASTPMPQSFYTDFNQIEVDLATLDELIDRGICLPPNLIKIDVEGAESLVIEGALKTLTRHKPTILVEIHSFENMLRIARLLPPNQFKIQVLKDEARRCFVQIETFE